MNKPELETFLNSFFGFKELATKRGVEHYNAQAGVEINPHCFALDLPDPTTVQLHCILIDSYDDSSFIIEFPSTYLHLSDEGWEIKHQQIKADTEKYLNSRTTDYSDIPF